ncbi:MAG: BrnT family toxin [Deltaproteobacteria bacterium]|nr:BrnT family toxin [Deltaproteobacteria bacterium]
MVFEWNPEKSKKNKKKHGVSFYEAKEIWQWKRLDFPNIAYSKEGEARSATIGFVKGILYTAIWTARGTCIRLICVRRARDGEKKAFFEKI